MSNNKYHVVQPDYIGVHMDFDTDGDDDTDETVTYEYDLSSNRTKLTLPGDLSITYEYDAKGQLVSLTDWDDQQTDFTYDRVGRHKTTQRPDSFRSEYRYNPAGHLRRIRHMAGNRTLAHFEYEVDGRGNRTQVSEQLAQPATVLDTIDKDNIDITYFGAWIDEGDFKLTADTGARLSVEFEAQELKFTI